VTGSVTWDVADRPLGDEEVLRALAAALEHGGWPDATVDVILVDAEHLTRLHRDYLDDPTPTDVITFDLRSAGDTPAPGAEEGPEAEIYVSVDRAREVAERRGVPVARELALYVVHGALHLCGLDDLEPEPRERMRAAERAVMTRLGYAADDAPHEDGVS
jgi:probable rRNA maturation factor